MLVVLSDCDCKDWNVSIKEVDRIFSWAFIHGVEYRGEIFKYCPWCGKKREQSPLQNFKEE